MSKKGGSQKLKDQNRWQLWLIIAANAVVFYGACQWETFELSGIKAALAGAANLLPVGLAIVVAEFVAHDSRLRFRSLNHVSGGAIKPR